ncbi:MAG: hypothetical protein AOA65_0898 [Candidatus Bathyarchaeota archaeon BA1]|nr:MAG: hypothetical protein AOA65_0898 [Candidatus Bathyarchaeota archaeon BA1]
MVASVSQKLVVDPGKKARAIVLVVALTASLVVTLAGTISWMSPSEAQGIVKEVEGQIPYLVSIAAIFGNNFMHCLIMFTPILGPIYALYVLYSTGRVLAAFAMVRGIAPFFLFGFTFLFPHAWVEYMAYALAMSQSVWLIVGLAQRRFKAEAINTCVSITVCALLLLLAAVIEISLLK